MRRDAKDGAKRTLGALRLLGGSQLALATLLHAASARAAETGAPDGQATLAAEIIVTAQRREQNLQRVPISITALSADTIKQANLTDTLSISRLAPNTTVRIFGSTPNIFIRGIGLNDYNASSVPPSAVYRDEVVLVAPAAQVFPLFDLERVEVLKGPQGTLFGRNTTGGAIALISRRPTNDFGGYVDVSGGSDWERGVEAAINVPISPSFQLRLSGSSRNTDGDRVMLDGRRSAKIDTQAARIVTQFDPGSGLEWTTIGYAGRNRNGYRAPKPLGVLPGGTDILGYADPFADDPDRLNFDNDRPTDIWDLGLTNIVQFEMGSVTLKSITGYDKSGSVIHGDVDGSPLALNQQRYDTRIKAFTQEFNLSGDVGGLQWVAGLFYEHDDLAYDIDFNFLGALAPIGQDLPLRSFSARRTNSYAAYAQGTYSLAPRLRVTGGLRYTQDKLRSSTQSVLVYGYFDPAVPDAPAIPVVPLTSLKQSFGRWSYRAAVEYDLADRTMAFASVNHSFKQGGVFLTLITSPLQFSPFSPETNTAYEAGLKMRLAGDALRLNLALFYNDYKDQQVVAIIPSVFPPITRIQNAASASTYGVEADFTLIPTEGLRIEGGIGWLHARFGSYPNATTDPLGNPVDDSGNPLPGAPNWTGNLAATYRTQLSGGWRGAIRVDYSYVGKRYFDPDKNPLTSDGAYGLLGARLSLRPNDRLEFSIWGRNLTDAIYLENASDLRALGFIPRYYGDRRSMGGSIRFDF
jgi:iron complex outermembrane receptor protein